MHPYEKLPLFGTGLVLAITLIVSHAVALLKSQSIIHFVQKLPRNERVGRILVVIGLAWVWLLIAPEGLGIFSALNLDMGDFNAGKSIFRLVLLPAIVLVPLSIKDFLSLRSLGLLGLLAAHPLLEASFQKDPSTRILIPLYVYPLIITCLYMVGMPYIIRNLIQWITAEKSRWNLLCLGGLSYGVIMLITAILFWKGF